MRSIIKMALSDYDDKYFSSRQSDSSFNFSNAISTNPILSWICHFLQYKLRISFERIRNEKQTNVTEDQIYEKKTHLHICINRSIIFQKFFSHFTIYYSSLSIKSLLENNKLVFASNHNRSDQDWLIFRLKIKLIELRWLLSLNWIIPKYTDNNNNIACSFRWCSSRLARTLLILIVAVFVNRFLIRTSTHWLETST